MLNNCCSKRQIWLFRFSVFGRISNFFDKCWVPTILHRRQMSKKVNPFKVRSNRRRVLSTFHHIRDCNSSPIRFGVFIKIHKTRQLLYPAAVRSVLREQRSRAPRHERFYAALLSTLYQLFYDLLWIGCRWKIERKHGEEVDLCVSSKFRCKVFLMGVPPLLLPRRCFLVYNRYKSHKLREHTRALSGEFEMLPETTWATNDTDEDLHFMSTKRYQYFQSIWREFFSVCDMKHCKKPE